MNNYQRMERSCFRFVIGAHPALCVCGDYYWEHSHRISGGRRWVLIHDEERERMRNRWYEEVNTRRYQRYRRNLR